MLDVHLSKFLFVRLRFTHDFATHRGILLGTFIPNARGLQVLVKEYIITYTDEQFHNTIKQYWPKTRNTFNSGNKTMEIFDPNEETGGLRVVGWFESSATENCASPHLLFNYFHQVVLQTMMETRPQNSTQGTPNLEKEFRNEMKDFIGIQIQKGESIERSDKVDILRNSVTLYSTYLKATYLNTLYERVCLHQTSTIFNSSIPTSTSTPTAASTTSSSSRNGEPPAKKQRVETPKVIEQLFRKDVNLIVQTGMMSKLYETQQHWDNEIFSTPSDELPAQDIQECTEKVFQNGALVTSTESIVQSQLKNLDALVKEYQTEYEECEYLLFLLDKVNHELQSVHQNGSTGGKADDDDIAEDEEPS